MGWLFIDWFCSVTAVYEAARLQLSMLVVGPGVRTDVQIDVQM